MLDFYKVLRPAEKAAVWVAGVALIALIVVYGDSNEGFAAAAQVAAAVGTFILAALAFSQVREMKETRLAQERPQVIVDADYYPDSRINVVVRNIGKGSAKDITFDFSAPMVSSLSLRQGSETPPVNEFSYFRDGIPFLAPGAEIVTLWDSAIGLFPVLRERGLEEGITITSKYRSLTGEYHETPWTINPLRMTTLDTDEKGLKHIVRELEKIRMDFHRIIDPLNKELRASTLAERDDRRQQRESQDDDGEGS